MYDFIALHDEKFQAPREYDGLQTKIPEPVKSKNLK